MSNQYSFLSHIAESVDASKGKKKVEGKHHEEHDAKRRPKKIQERAGFEDSVAATEFMEKIRSMLKDKHLSDWARHTDNNFDADTVSLLDEARDAFERFMDAMDDAG